MKGLNLSQAIEPVIRKYVPVGLRRVIKKIEHSVGRNPSFVILSTGRAGSTYSAHLLKQAGLNCAHEMFFTPNGFFRSLRYDGDSSWLAVPYLEKSQQKSQKVVHQVRNPLDVVSSYQGIGFFDPKNKSPFANFVREHFEVTGDPLLDSVRFWVEWNLRAERLSEKTYLFEDLLVDPGILFSCLGVGVDDSIIQQLKYNARTKVNSRKRVEVSLSDIPNSNEKDEMVALALRYGYELE